MEIAGEARTVQFSDRDRDTPRSPSPSTSFDAVFAAWTAEPSPPPSAPRANASCARVTGTIRRESPDTVPSSAAVTLRQSLPSTSSSTTHTSHSDPSPEDRPLIPLRPPPTIDTVDDAALQRADRLDGLIHNF